MNLKPVLTVILFFLITYKSLAQSGCNFEASYKGESVIINKECAEQYSKGSSTTAELKLGPQGRITMTAALRKGLEWADINSTRNLRFKKLIAECPAKASTNISTTLFEAYAGVAIIFVGETNGQYTIKVVGDRFDGANLITYERNRPKGPFDIDSVGMEILSFTSSAQVYKFISLLESKPDNLSDIFK